MSGNQERDLGSTADAPGRESRPGDASRPEQGDRDRDTGTAHSPGTPVPAARPARESRVEMMELVLPNDANPLGNILGGKVMHLMDIAGAMAASRHSRRVCVTASVDSIDFLRPIKVGQAILLEAQVTDAARTSMEVRVNVYSENLKTGERHHTATAFFTFVALDENGRPTPVPAVIAETPEEKRLQEEARERRRARLLRTGRIKPAPEAAPSAEAAGGPAAAVPPVPAGTADGTVRHGGAEPGSQAGESAGRAHEAAGGGRDVPAGETRP
ncbi:MAG TPA: acyl-CoA thioesterase [Thermaerobacter sp.]